MGLLDVGKTILPQLGRDNCRGTVVVGAGKGIDVSAG